MEYYRHYYCYYLGLQLLLLQWLRILFWVMEHTEVGLDSFSGPAACALTVFSDNSRLLINLIFYAQRERKRDSPEL